MSRKSVILKPHLGPRDGIDVAQGLFIAVPLGLIAVVLPPAVFWVLGLSPFWNLVAYTWIMIAIRRPVIRALKLTSDGIHIMRRFGETRHVPWRDLRGVRPAERAEVFRSWLRIPPREFTQSWTTLGHYRFEFDEGPFYFAPSDPERFERALARYWMQPDAA